MTKKITLNLVIAIIITVIVFVGHQIRRLDEKKSFTIDKQLKEISGIEFDRNKKLWAINDGGDGAKLYQLNGNGEITRTIEIENAKNWDWEDMTQDVFGHFFIGDFGNNGKDRQWMTIYKIENPIDIKSDKTKAEIIKFTHPEYQPDQDDQIFKDAHYDIEAFIYFKRKLYLFTKNRTSPFDGKTRVYRVGDHAANFKAEYVNEFKTCTHIKELCWITSAALSPDNTKLVLLDSERIWLFENWQGDDFFSGDAYQINLGIVTQKEAVAFLDNNTVIFTDEIFSGIGGNGYMIKLDEAQKTAVAKPRKSGLGSSTRKKAKAQKKRFDKQPINSTNNS